MGNLRPIPDLTATPKMVIQRATICKPCSPTVLLPIFLIGQAVNWLIAFALSYFIEGSTDMNMVARKSMREMKMNSSRF